MKSFRISWGYSRVGKNTHKLLASQFVEMVYLRRSNLAITWDGFGGGKVVGSPPDDCSNVRELLHLHDHSRTEVVSRCTNSYWQCVLTMEHTTYE